MTPYQRQEAVNRLLANKVSIRLLDRTIFLGNATHDVVFAADLLYREILSSQRFAGLLRLNQCQDLLMNIGLCPRDIEQQIKNADRALEDMQIDLYKRHLNLSANDIKRLKQQIQRQKVFVSKLDNMKTRFNEYTLESFADTYRFEYILRNSLCDADGSPIEVSDEDFDLVLMQRSREILSPDGLREIAHNDPWKTIWHIYKPNPFKCERINEEQRVLLMFSRMYENIDSHPEAPNDDVIDDDDMLDGWLIMQRRKSQQEHKERELDRLLGKSADAQELFIPVNSMEHARRVQDLNTQQGRDTKAQRQQIIMTKGKVEDGELPDKKLEKVALTIQQIKDNRR